MTANLITIEKVCWRCGGARRINHEQDLCPGCQGTGLQGHLRPARGRSQATALPDGGVVTITELLAPRADQPCPSCSGSGYRMYQRVVSDGSGRIETVTEPCTGCGGRGRVG